MGCFAPAPYEAAFGWRGTVGVLVFLFLAPVCLMVFAMLFGGTHNELLYIAITPSVFILLGVILERVQCLQPRWPPERIAEFATENWYAEKVTYYISCAVIPILGFALTIGIATGLEHVIHAPVDLSKSPRCAIIPIGIFVHHLGSYWVHFATHKFHNLFRLHQAHHTPKKYDYMLTMYKHPLETVALLIPTLLVFLCIFKVRTNDLLWIEVARHITATSVHLNIRTPWLMGFFITRPEQHVLHHEEPWPRPEGWNRVMFSELPICDIMFGTFVNPKRDPREAASLVIGMQGNVEEFHSLWTQMSFKDMRTIRAEKMRCTVTSPTEPVADGDNDSADGQSAEGRPARREEDPSGKPAEAPSAPPELG